MCEMSDGAGRICNERAWLNSAEQRSTDGPVFHRSTPPAMNERDYMLSYMCREASYITEHWAKICQASSSAVKSCNYCVSDKF